MLHSNQFPHPPPRSVRSTYENAIGFEMRKKNKTTKIPNRRGNAKPSPAPCGALDSRYPSLYRCAPLLCQTPVFPTPSITLSSAMITVYHWFHIIPRFAWVWMVVERQNRCSSRHGRRQKGRRGRLMPSRPLASSPRQSCLRLRPSRCSRKGPPVSASSESRRYQRSETQPTQSCSTATFL